MASCVRCALLLAGCCSAECEAARLQVHGMEVQRMKDKETVRQQFEEIEHAFVRSSIAAFCHAIR